MEPSVLAALFPGQGSQSIGMGSQLYQDFLSLRRLFQEAEDIVKSPLYKIMQEGPADLLNNTCTAQPALCTLSVGIAHILENEFGISDFSFFAGHSLGEYAALCVAGCVSFQDMMTCIQTRASLMNQASEGGMLAVIGLSREVLETLLEEGVVIANDNTPQQLVLSGPKDALRLCHQKAQDLSAKCVVLPVSGAFHSPLMKEAEDRMRPLIESISFSAPKAPLFTNVSGEAQKDPLVLKEHLIRQMTGPVLWRTTQLSLEKQGVTQCLELGAGSVLTGLARKTIPQVPCTPIHSTETLRGITYNRQPSFISLAGGQ